jgi:hypothetical protein
MSIFTASSGNQCEWSITRNTMDPRETPRIHLRWSMNPVSLKDREEFLAHIERTREDRIQLASGGAA